MNKHEIQRRNIPLDLNEEELKLLVAALGFSAEITTGMVVNLHMYADYLTKHVQEIPELCERITTIGNFVIDQRLI